MWFPQRHQTRARSPFLLASSIVPSPAQQRTQSWTAGVQCRGARSPAENKKPIAIAEGAPCSQFATSGHNASLHGSAPGTPQLACRSTLGLGPWLSYVDGSHSQLRCLIHGIQVSTLTFVFGSGENVVVKAACRPLPVGTRERQPLTTVSELRFGDGVCGPS